MAHPPLRRLVDHLRRRAYAGGPESDRALLAAYGTSRDEAAFAELVRRHAGMVLGVARRVLGDAHTAEDVGQAAFLVLARRAGAIRWRESVAGWLHDVAYRLALKARAAGRRPRLPSNSRAPGADPAATAADRELRELLDAELRRLPARYRAPLVLCYLEGRTRDEAARQLDVSLPALRGRLERGREMLRVRLLKRGYCLGLSLTAAALADDASAAVPIGRWATVAAAGVAGQAVVSDTVERLAGAALVGGVITGVSHYGGIAMRFLLFAVPVFALFGLSGPRTDDQPAPRPADPQAAQPAARIKWEYKWVIADELRQGKGKGKKMEAEYEEALNKLGEEGWELAGICSAGAPVYFAPANGLGGINGGMGLGGGFGGFGGGFGGGPGAAAYVFKRPK
jgi:RNA polymerase sigma factor (sigma-70 family)